jgi:hypothetical protein
LLPGTGTRTEAAEPPIRPSAARRLTRYFIIMLETSLNSFSARAAFGRGRANYMPCRRKALEMSDRELSHREHAYAYSAIIFRLAVLLVPDDAATVLLRPCRSDLLAREQTLIFLPERFSRLRWRSRFHDRCPEPCPSPLPSPRCAPNSPT